MFGRSLVKGPSKCWCSNQQEEFRQSNVGVMTSQDQADQHWGHCQVSSEARCFCTVDGDRLRRWSVTFEKGWHASFSTRQCTKSQWSRSLEKRQPRTGPRSGCQKAPRGMRDEAWMPQSEGTGHRCVPRPGPSERLDQSIRNLMQRFWVKRFGPTWRTSTVCPPSPMSFT